MTLTKADMTERLFNELDWDQRETKALVENFFEALRVALEQGEPIKLSGFGNFQRREKNSRPGRNPKTGTEHLITARRVVTFRAGQKLKVRIKLR